MWSTRNGRAHLYLSRRVNGVPTKVYVGTGPAAQVRAAELEARKAAQHAARQAARDREAAVRAAEAPLDVLCAALDQLTAAVLLGRGYHRHNRGPWRKKRETAGTVVG